MTELEPVIIDFMHCGVFLENGWNFCPECGTPVKTFSENNARLRPIGTEPIDISPDDPLS